jgi:hypothetical protein
LVDRGRIYLVRKSDGKDKGLEMKFVVRRAVVGVLAVPVVAGLYVFGYVALMLMGAEPTSSSHEVFVTGIEFGAVFAVMFTFSTQLGKFLDKVVGN